MPRRARPRLAGHRRRVTALGRSIRRTIPFLRASEIDSLAFLGPRVACVCRAQLARVTPVVRLPRPHRHERVPLVGSGVRGLLIQPIMSFVTRKAMPGAMAVLCVALGGCCDPETQPPEPLLIAPVDGTWLVTNPGLVVYPDTGPQECLGASTSQLPDQEWFRVLFTDTVGISSTAEHDSLVVFILDGFAGEFSNGATECHGYPGGGFDCFNKVFSDGPLGASIALGYAGQFADASNGSLTVDVGFINDTEDVLCSMWMLLGIAHGGAS